MVTSALSCQEDLKALHKCHSINQNKSIMWNYPNAVRKMVYREPFVPNLKTLEQGTIKFKESH